MDLGVGGVSFVELLILYELWAGERLVLEKAVPRRRVAQFQCRLFRLVQALIFGALVGILVRCFVLLLVCLAVFEGSFLVILVLITAGFGSLGRRSVVMALLPGPVSRPRKFLFK